MSRRKEGEIRIAYGALPNVNERRGGFMPIIWVNGRQRGDTYGRGHDRDDACKIAHEEAKEHASRYLGDFNVRILGGCARGKRRRGRR